MSPEQTSDSWFLHSQGRRFGPLSEDELRGYFRAGMVKADDLITVPGELSMKPAAEVAQRLQESPPAPVPSPSPHARWESSLPGGASPLSRLPPGIVFPSSMQVSEPGIGKRWILPAVLLLTMCLLLYLSLLAMRRAHPSPMRASSSPAVGAVSDTAKLAPVVMPPPQVASVPDQAVTDSASAVGPAPVTSPDAADAQLATANRLWREADWTGLLAHCRQWALAEPELDLPWLFMGSAESRLGNYSSAIDDLNHILASQPDHLGARAALSDVYMRSGQFQNAAEILRGLVRSSPGDPRLWNNMGTALLALGRNDDAVAALETAVRIDPGYHQAWASLAVIYQRAGHADQAAAAQAKANAAQ